MTPTEIIDYASSRLNGDIVTISTKNARGHWEVISGKFIAFDTGCVILTQVYSSIFFTDRDDDYPDSISAVQIIPFQTIEDIKAGEPLDPNRKWALRPLAAIKCRPGVREPAARLADSLSQTWTTTDPEAGPYYCTMSGKQFTKGYYCYQYPLYLCPERVELLPEILEPDYSDSIYGKDPLADDQSITDPFAE